MLDHPVYTARQPISEPQFAPNRTALVVVDVQRFTSDPRFGFGKMAKAAGSLAQAEPYYERVQELLPRLRKLQDACRSRGMEVMFTRIEANTHDGRDLMPGYRLSGVIVPKGSVEAEILPEVAPAADEIVLSKTSSGAFNSTALDQILRNLSIDRIIVAGVSTHACVELTVRDADDRGYWVYVASDACTAATERLHTDSLARIKKGLILIKTTNQLVELIQTAPASEFRA
jgi:nicotinamidase-related amidase